MSPSEATDPPRLERERHLKYWTRCLRTLLPQQYTGMDSTRMTLGFFIVAAIDVLSDQPAKWQTTPLLTSSDRRRLRAWVLACQHPSGGFCGSPTHVVPEWRGALDVVVPGRRQKTSAQQPTAANHAGANLAATYFALLLLALLTDGDEEAESCLLGVRRRATLAWLRRLQRPDGSFGELVFEDGGEGWAGEVQGARDMRFCYFAATVRWILRGDGRDSVGTEDEEDIDVDALVRFIRQGQTYDGGVAESGQHEPHGESYSGRPYSGRIDSYETRGLTFLTNTAGYAFCAISALSLLDRPGYSSSAHHASSTLRRGVRDLPGCVRFLVSRQFAYLEPPARADDESDEEDTDNFFEPSSLGTLALDDRSGENATTGPPLLVAYNGRCNKTADTCYCWWVGGALSILGHGELLSVESSRAFLLAKTQHRLVGGFSKHAEGRPDIYHSYLGLAALAALPGGHEGLKEFDTALCVSVDTVRKLESGRRGLLKGGKLASREGGAVVEGEKVSAQTRLLQLASAMEEEGSVSRETAAVA